MKVSTYELQAAVPSASFPAGVALLASLQIALARATVGFRLVPAMVDQKHRLSDGPYCARRTLNLVKSVYRHVYVSRFILTMDMQRIC